MKLTFICLLGVLSLGMISCNQALNTAQLRDEYSADTSKESKLYQKGKSEESKGDLRSAAKVFDSLAEAYPTYSESSEAVFKAGQYWEKLGEPQRAFASYQYYIATFDRQSVIAFSAAKGELVKTFLGLKSEPDYVEVIELLTKVRQNAPATDLAVRAQFAMGTYSEGQEKVSEAVSAYLGVLDSYPTHALAPEANLRVAKMFAGISDEGNQNSSNIQNSRDTLADLIQQYPNSSQAKEARELLSKVDGLEVQRTFEIASFYEKKGQHSSAKYYYEEVLSKAVVGSHYHNLAKEKLNNL